MKLCNVIHEIVWTATYIICGLALLLSTGVVCECATIGSGSVSANISLPDGWISDPSKASSANAQLFATRPDKENSSSYALQIYARKVAPPGSFGEVMDDSLSDFKKSFQGFNLLSMTDSDLSGYPMREFIFNRTSASGLDLKCRLICVLVKDVKFYFSCNTPAESFDYYDSDLSSLVGSVEWITDNPIPSQTTDSSSQQSEVGGETQSEPVSDTNPNTTSTDSYPAQSADNSQPDTENTSDYSFLWPIGIGIIIILIIASIFSTRCPECKKFFAKQTTGTREVGRKDGYENVTRKDVIRDGKGKEIATRDRVEQVHVTYVTYESYHRCKFCDHGWANKFTRRIEG